MTNNMLTSSNSISQALNLTPLVPITTAQVKAVIENDDYQTAKGNMHNIIEVGTDAMNKLSENIALSQDPRAFRVLTELLSVMVTANKELMEIGKTKTEIDKLNKVEDNQTINNNLFVGSTADLVKMLGEIKTKPPEEG
jgi:hypothetical protein